MKQIRVGIIGLGMIGAVHLDALRRIPGVLITAISDKSPERLKTFQKAFGIEHVFSDWHDLVSSDHVDAVHNCTPNHLHHAVNLACLKAGKMVFSEKPLGIDPKDTQVVAKKAAQTGIPAGVNFPYRYYPMVQWARQLVMQGFVGEVRAVHGHYLQDWLMYEDDFNWRVDSRLGGETRVLADIGSHWLDLAQYITGLDVLNVLGDLETMLPKRWDAVNDRWVEVDTEDWASVLLQFSNRVRGNFIVSQVSGGHKNDLQIEIVGSKCSLRWCQENPETLWIGKRGGVNQLRYKDPEAFSPGLKEFSRFPAGHPEGYGDCMRNAISNFYRCVITGSDDYPTFAWGHRITELVSAIAASSREKRWVGVSPSEIGGDAA